MRLHLLLLCAASCALLMRCQASPDAATGQSTQSVTTADTNAVVTTATPAAAPKTTPTGTTIGSAAPGMATGYDPNGTVKPKTSNPNAATNANTTASSTSNANATTSTPVTTGYKPVPWPNIGFVDYAGSLGKKVVALTFDDGPDGKGTGLNNTASVLDFLKNNGIKASFFVCGDVWTTVTSDAEAQADLQRIIAEGHDIGTHTFTHPHLDTISSSEITTQFADNLAMAKSVLGSSFNFSMYRAPFGFPFQSNNPNVPWVAPAVAPNGVHIGWGIDTDDWKCAQNGQNSNCILTNLKAQLDNGHSGPILMHAVYQLTVDTLPAVVAMLKSYGYTFATVSQMIADKYKATSQEILTANTAANFSYDDISAFAVSECANNNYIEVIY